MKKRALVCTICEEVSWVAVAEIQTTTRKWWVCHGCYETTHDEWY